MAHRLIRCTAEDIAEWERAAPTPDDDPQARIVIVSPELALDAGIELIPSWGADTPEASWIEVQLRIQHAAGWSRLYRMARWDSAAQQSRRSSFDAQRDDHAYVATDTLIALKPAQAVQVRVLLCAEPGADMPDLEFLALCVSDETDAEAVFTPPPSVPALELPLLIAQHRFAEGAGWCSPTSVTMALAYWRSRVAEPRLAEFAAAAAVEQISAPQIFDPAWDGTGNWSFNVAFAAAPRMTAFVTRLNHLEQAARWVAAGVPVIISISWDAGQIDGAPGETAGHLTMLIGFADDKALIAEPAGRETILRAYPAAQVFAHWQAASRGTVYLIHPPDWPVPAATPADAW